ncbi:MAG: hypothetical protein AB7F98_02215 [Novosphingobium sp.]
MSACSDGAGYPSLSRRDVEKSPAATPEPAPPAESADLAPRLAGLVDQARAAHEKFASRRARAEQLATSARGATMASESWSIASVALADLEASRSEAMIALADLDQIYAAARIEGGDGATIAAARDQVMAMIGEEDDVLAALRGKLGG